MKPNNKEKEKTIENIFNNCWHKYWYDKKSLSKRLRDSIIDEQEVCALFFEVLVENDYIALKENENKQ